ncbi:MAG: prenyltransferase [Halobacteriaceae archaeon]
MASSLGTLLTRSRPRFWLYLAGPVVVGIAFGARATAELITPTTIALFAYFLVPANLLLYGINDVFDADIDVYNPKKEGREVRYTGDTVAVGAVVVSGGLGLALFALVPPIAYGPLLGFFVLAIAYSTPPARFKTSPFLDSFSNGLYILPGVAAYATVLGRLPPAAAIVSGWFWTMGMHTFSAIPDIEPDRRAGIETTATYLGKRRTYAYVAACWLVAALALAVVDVRAGALLGVYPLFVAGIVGSEVAVDRAYWWFPALNTAVGMLLTLGGLWRLVHG